MLARLHIRCHFQWPCCLQTVGTGRSCWIGCKDRPNIREQPIKINKTTSALEMKFVRKFGIFAIIASLCSGCVSVPHRYMTVHELNSFVPDCALRDQQIAMLMSQYVTHRDEQAFSVRGFTGHTAQTNWLIRSHVIYLRDYCR